MTPSAATPEAKIGRGPKFPSPNPKVNHWNFPPGHSYQVHSKAVHCAQVVRAKGSAVLLLTAWYFFALLFLCVGNFWASPSPPNVRVARGEGQPPRASARGPARGGGHNLLDFILVEVAGGNPKVDLNGLRGQVLCLPFLYSTPERGLTQLLRSQAPAIP